MTHLTSTKFVVFASGNPFLRTMGQTVFSEEKEERKKMVYCFPFGYRKNVERK
jgi:hypothetical protein